MLLEVRARSAYDLADESFLILMVEPALVGPTHRVLRESLSTTPTPSSQLWIDGAGNPQRRLVASKGWFSFDFAATIEAQANGLVPEDAIEFLPGNLPLEALVYTLPSRYCQSDRLIRLAQSEFAAIPPGGRRVLAISEWIRTHVEYRYGTTDASTSAADTAIERVGVCRDFAHLFIAFARALGIPARYVSGYALDLDPPDFHGFAQVYVGGGWHNVDPTAEQPRPALVPIAVGRDAADVAITTLWGNGTLIEQTVEVREVAPGPESLVKSPGDYAESRG